MDHMEGAVLVFGSKIVANARAHARTHATQNQIPSICSLRCPNATCAQTSVQYVPYRNHGHRCTPFVAVRSMVTSFAACRRALSASQARDKYWLARLPTGTLTEGSTLVSSLCWCSTGGDLEGGLAGSCGSGEGPGAFGGELDGVLGGGDGGQ